MAKRSLGWTEEKIARYVKAGRGLGEGVKYVPWLFIQDVPSTGRAHRIKGNKTGRIHHLLSDLERDYFFNLEWADEVIDIREQFPMERERTVAIAEEYGLRHPTDQQTKTPIVMTTDFLITVRKQKQISYIARTIKPSEQLNNPRTIQKFAIEQEYWLRRNVDWGIVTELDLSKVLCRNLAFFHAHLHVDSEVSKTAHYLLDHLQVSNARILSDALSEYEMFSGSDKGEALAAFKHLVATKQIRFDIHTVFTKRMAMSEIEIIYHVDDSLRRVR